MTAALASLCSILVLSGYGAVHPDRRPSVAVWASAPILVMSLSVVAYLLRCCAPLREAARRLPSVPFLFVVVSTPLTVVASGMADARLEQLLGVSAEALSTAHAALMFVYLIVLAGIAAAGALVTSVVALAIRYGLRQVKRGPRGVKGVRAEVTNRVDLLMILAAYFASLALPSGLVHFLARYHDDATQKLIVAVAFHDGQSLLDRCRREPGHLYKVLAEGEQVLDFDGRRFARIACGR